MLNREERRAIEGLFDRLAEAERRTPERDPEAEALIGAELRRLPSAPYYMAQTIVVQQQGLEAADARIRDLEAQLAQRDELGGQLVCYARSVVHQEWPRMDDGTQGDAINPWAVELFETFHRVDPQTPAEQAAYSKWLDQTSDREQAR
ncbi:DUF2076 domain-containing protein, partial [Devosia sp.]|uniref:DUF2076 domain-containing protein n=1 Tax=Devosia sp. TaxID=1871048 RepID=UPI001AC86491